MTNEEQERLMDLALEVGETFRMIRIGEDHPETTKCRLELEKPYLELAAYIKILCDSPAIDIDAIQSSAFDHGFIAGQGSR